jgi:hypothetical protein
MANTFDTSRVGGGTYELAQDANGNYNLKSVGFNQVNKLNLPDLKDSNTSVADTTKKATEDTIKTQTTEVFKPTNVYQGGGNNDNVNYNTPTVKEATVKEATVSELGQKTNTTYNAMSDAEKASVAAGTSGMTFRGTPTSKTVGPNQTVVDTTKTYTTPRTIADQNKYLGTSFTDKTTGLQKVQSAVQNTVGNVIDSVKNNKAIQFTSNALGFALNPIMGGLKAVAGMMPEMTAQQKRDRDYFNLNPADQGGRIAGNPATNVFAGMNAVSMFGDVTKGAQSRVDNRNKTATKNAGKWSKDKMDKFNKKTETFEKQIQEKNDSDRDERTAEAAAEPDTGMGSCFIAGTKVTMADGTLKNIENIVVGDKVKGHKEDNTVIKLDPTLLANRKLYSFNNSNHYFFTSEHPFMTEEGWKSVKPEKTKERDGIELYNQLKGELKIGDKLITEDGSIEIKDIKSKEISNPDMPLYNFNVSNDSSYVADKYIVHNKGGGNQRVICTELHRTKDLSTRDWIRDTKFTFKTLSKTHVKGYLLWAEPTVKHMQKYPKYRKMWKHIAQHRANDIAWRLNEGKFDLLGRIYAGIGEPVCWALGNFVSDKQISKYNLTHWRRA